MVPALVTTCVFELQHGRADEIVGFWTVAAPIGEVADFYEEKYRWTCDQAYEPVPFPEACQNLLIALDGSLHLPETCVINCDTLASIPRSRLDPEPVGVLDFSKRVALDRALRYSLDILV